MVIYTRGVMHEKNPRVEGFGLLFDVVVIKGVGNDFGRRRDFLNLIKAFLVTQPNAVVLGIFRIDYVGGDKVFFNPTRQFLQRHVCAIVIVKQIDRVNNVV